MKWLILALAFIPGSALATESVVAKSPSATITSDDSTIDFRTGTNTFTGNVSVDHAAFELYADKLVEKRNGETATTITATGSPARFRQKPPLTEQISHGTAERLVYDGESKELRMWNYVITDIYGNVMKGNTVVYLLVDQPES